MENKHFSFAGVPELTKRNILLFTKNKITVFFSLLAPILILVIYVLFMGEIQGNVVRGYLGEDVVISNSIISGIVNSWMVAGVVGISCLTVALNSMLVIITDKEKKVVNDFIASPVNPVNLLLSYFFASFILTFCMCLIVLSVCMTFMVITTGIFFTFAECMELLLILLLSCLSAVIVLMCIMIFFKSTAACTAFTGVFSALIGFLVGAYLPMSMLPKGIQNLASLIPGSHSVGLFRNIFLNKVLDNLPENLPTDFIDNIKKTYSYDLNLFNSVLGRSEMYIYLSVSIVLFFVIYLIIDQILKRVRKS